MTSYTVTAERSGKWWALQCVEVPGALSQVARLDQAQDMIREAIAWVADVPESDIEIEMQVTVPEQAIGALEDAERLRQESEELNRRAANESAHAVEALHSAGLTLREIGSLLDISHQRVFQLLARAQAQAVDTQEARSGSGAAEVATKSRKTLRHGVAGRVVLRSATTGRIILKDPRGATKEADDSDGQKVVAANATGRKKSMV